LALYNDATYHATLFNLFVTTIINYPVYLTASTKSPLQVDPQLLDRSKHDLITGFNNWLIRIPRRRQTLHPGRISCFKI
jgi:hypothetical protein